MHYGQGQRVRQKRYSCGYSRQYNFCDTKNNSYFDITAVDVNKIQRMGNLINSMNNTRYNCSFYIIVMIKFRVEVNISR